MIKRYFLSVVFLLCFSGCRSSIVDDPTTRISFAVAQPSHVKLEIENSYSTVMAVPVDGDMAAGVYAVDISASSWVEGVYYYTLEYKGLSSDYYVKTTRNLLLIK